MVRPKDSPLSRTHKASCHTNSTIADTQNERTSIGWAATRGTHDRAMRASVNASGSRATRKLGTVSRTRSAFLRFARRFDAIR